MSIESQCGYVFGYINPDSDGVCSSIGYEFYSANIEKNFRAVIFGSINNETKFILRKLDILIPEMNPRINPLCQIAIVDTHDRRQLPFQINLQNVVEVIDHHPYGNALDFPNAEIQNEKVGAVATLITERIKALKVKPTEKVAGVLGYAIISNTLNFKAPSATERDKKALEWLSGFKNVSSKSIKEMFTERSFIGDKSTDEILKSDYKQFTISNKEVGISQLETTNPSAFINRKDIRNAFSKIINLYKIDYFFVNVVSVLENSSILIAFDTDTKKILEKAVGAKFDKSESRFPKILLRKTDLVPGIEKLFKVKP
jgi:manganese-dependent inorganic pyrophosphatase